MDVKLSSRNHQKQIAELEEWREKAYHSAKLYKERTKRWNDHRIQQKEFKDRDKVLIFNSQVKLFVEGKLRSKWQGPYTVINTSPHGTITIQYDDGNIFKVNGQRLKVFLEPSYKTNLEIDTIDLISFDKFIQNLWNFKNNNANNSFIYLKSKNIVFFLSKLSWPNDHYALTRQTMILAYSCLIFADHMNIHS